MGSNTPIEQLDDPQVEFARITSNADNVGVTTQYYSARKSDLCNKSVMVTMLEHQVRLIEEERDQLCTQKVQLMLEVEEYKQMANKMAISIKDTDKVRRNEFVEQDDYINSLESQLDHF